jgi:hypothetical protein
MDEPGWAWPAWKFGMKREDLTTKLHDQYNTFMSTIQDPEAFHHDVSEIAHEASTTDEFHRLMAARQQERIKELNDSLESAAIEIIGNPKLIGTEQWQYALQLFRTKSLDSLVRYFASYLPEHYLYRHDHGYQTPSSTASSFADYSSVRTASTNLSSVDCPCPATIFADDEDKSVFTHEPDTIHVSIQKPTSTHAPLSPRSITMKSDTAPSSPTNLSIHDFALPPPTPRTLSFSGSESGGIPHPFSHDDDETSQSEEGDTSETSEVDLSESRSSLDSVGCFSGTELGHEATVKKDVYEDEEEFPTAQLPVELDYEAYDNGLPTGQLPTYSEPMESETPTPRQEPQTSSYMDSKQIPTYCTQSPHRPPSPRSPKMRHRERSPVQGVRRSPEEFFSRIQKSMPDPTRTRPKGRRRLD